MPGKWYSFAALNSLFFTVLLLTLSACSKECPQCPPCECPKCECPTDAVADKVPSDEQVQPKKAVAEEGTPEWPIYPVDLKDFEDNARQYKGKVLKIVAKYQNMENLRRRRRAEFWAFDSDSSITEFWVNIPRRLKVPNASQLDELEVIFKCTKGRLNSGNIAISISRY